MDLFAAYRGISQQLIAGLVKRRAKLAGEAGALKARIARVVADTRQLDAVVRQFDPEHDLSAIRPKRCLRAADGAGPGRWRGSS